MRLGVGVPATLAILATSEAFVPQYQLSQTSSSFVQNGRITFRQPSVRKDIQLGMMFDQLSAALSDVARNFGPKKL